MPLESFAHKTALHKLGHDSVGQVDLDAYKPASGLEQVAQIPAPSLFKFDEPPPAPATSASKDQRNDGDDYDQFNRLPSVAECAAHLELLEVFYVIRQQILVSTAIDDAMDIHPKRVTKTGKKGDTKTLKDDTFWERRQEKWKRYLEFATVRFLAWSKSLGDNDTTRAGREPRTPKHLPPLDILMVWHSFLLNPRLFYDRRGTKLIWRLRFPWEAIHACINSDDWSFTLGDEDHREYQNTQNMPADLYKFFCEWTDARPLLGGSGKSEKPAIPLHQFSLVRARSIGAVPQPHNTMRARYIQRLSNAFAATDLDLADKLKDAVIRQSDFVDKMNAHLWIRSPAVEGTLRRALDRYDKFLGLLARGKKFTIVPTLDVDLAWHTNQCYSGLGYAAAMKSRVGRFINHDDTIAKDTLGDGFGETRKQWRVYYGKEYRICGCWDCEALTSAIEKASSPEHVKSIVTSVQESVKFYRVVEAKRRKQAPLPAMPESLREERRFTLPSRLPKRG